MFAQAARRLDVQGADASIGLFQSYKPSELADLWLALEAKLEAKQVEN